jgi:hypothetical protein
MIEQFFEGKRLFYQVEAAAQISLKDFLGKKLNLGSVVHLS